MPTYETGSPEQWSGTPTPEIMPDYWPRVLVQPWLHTERAMTAQRDATVIDVTDEDVTLGEVSRRLDRMESSEQGRFKALDDRMTVNLVTKDYYEGRSQVLSERIKRLEESSTARTIRWSQAWIAIAAALVASLGSLIIVLVHIQS
jgi:hypothetical protein